MSDAIVVRSVEEAQSLAGTLSASQIIPTALHKKPADVLAVILTGQELGFSPMQAIRAIQMIQGKPTLSAEAMVAVVRRSKDVCEYFKIVKSDATICTVETKRRGEEPFTLSFTMQQARTAGLSGANWSKYPDAMLRARATSAICRAMYSDLLMGFYEPDEMEQSTTVVVSSSRPPPMPEQQTTIQGGERVVESTTAVHSNDTKKPYSEPKITSYKPESDAIALVNDDTPDDAYGEALQNSEPPPHTEHEFQAEQPPATAWTVPFGSSKGKTLAELEEKELTSLGAYFEKCVSDPSKKKFIDSNRDGAARVAAELLRRQTPLIAPDDIEEEVKAIETFIEMAPSRIALAKIQKRIRELPEQRRTQVMKKFNARAKQVK